MQPNKPVVLVVDDDPVNLDILVQTLEQDYFLIIAKNGKRALDLAFSHHPDLILLDILMPEMDGFEVCQRLKADKETEGIPVIFLSVMESPGQKHRGFEVGGVDYVTKPFPMSVFQKKLSVVLGRLAKQSGGGDSYEDGALSINFSEMTASLSGKPLVFTPLEYRLLKILTKNPQNVLTRQVLLEKLWDADGNFVDEHALTAAISRVRNKIETEGRQYIKTVYGMGYMWIGGALK